LLVKSIKSRFVNRRKTDFAMLIPTEPTVVIVSDLHVGGGSLDDFDAKIELEFISFIAQLSSRPFHTQLVINGDFLEFVQAEPWDDPALRASVDDISLCFTEEQSVQKLEAIVRYHPNVFAALGGFLDANTGNELTILPGNHDADLFWPKVRAKLETIIQSAARCSIGGRLEVFLGQVYRPSRIPSLWIEHGHQHDRCNNFVVGNQDRWSEELPPYLPTQTGELRLIECVGTRFLLKFLNRLDASYPFVDNVKPFSKLIKMFSVSAVRPGYGPVSAAVAIWSMTKFLGSTARRSPNDFLSARDDGGASVTALVRSAWSKMKKSDQAMITQALRLRGFKSRSSIGFLLSNERTAVRVLDALSEHFDVAQMFSTPDRTKMGAKGSGKMTLVPGFIADESADLIVAASRALRHSDATAVAMGHTHDPQDHPNGINYVNTGSWTRYLSASAGNGPSSWALLKRTAQSHFPFRLMFAEVSISVPDSIKLNVWRSSDGI
jgi:UDP-2,3-diacylglucosamine pyrophosphatase LpxH